MAVDRLTWAERLPTQWVLVRIALKRQFRSLRWWWVLLVIGQLLFAITIVFAFSTLFPRVAGRGGTVNYALSVYAGILVWSLIQDSALQVLNLFRDHRAYIMRFRVPLWSYAVGVGGVRAMVFLIGVLILIVGHVALGDVIGWRWLTLTLFVPMVLALALGVAWLISVAAALEPRLQQLVPHVMLFWFFATPVVYPRAALPEGLRLLSFLNPMTHVVECFRWIFTPAQAGGLVSWGVTAGISLVVCVGGYLWTRARTRTIMDGL